MMLCVVRVQEGGFVPGHSGAGAHLGQTGQAGAEVLPPVARSGSEQGGFVRSEGRRADQGQLPLTTWGSRDRMPSPSRRVRSERSSKGWPPRPTRVSRVRTSPRPHGGRRARARAARASAGDVRSSSAEPSAMSRLLLRVTAARAPVTRSADAIAARARGSGRRRAPPWSWRTWRDGESAVPQPASRTAWHLPEVGDVCDGMTVSLHFVTERSHGARVGRGVCDVPRIRVSRVASAPTRPDRFRWAENPRSVGT